MSDYQKIPKVGEAKSVYNEKIRMEKLMKELAEKRKIEAEDLKKSKNIG